MFRVRHDREVLHEGTSFIMRAVKVGYLPKELFR
jgi:hypothetical protein